MNALYPLAIFLGAFLLFLVQPLIGKYILPWFGGGSGVWAVCLLFFQVSLLGGYAYAHAIVRWLRPTQQAAAHIGLLTISLLLLPIIPDAQWKPQQAGDPTGRILLLLLVTIGAPYVLLAATGPLLQAWFARTFPGKSPYRLYALSNAGSLLALLGYPFVVEPLLTRSTQAIFWSAAFAVFVVTCGGAAIRSLRAPHPAQTSDRKIDDTHHTESISPMRKVLWVLLPLCSTAMLLAVTNRITEEVAPTPLLWVVPLAIYLVTFIVCFEWPALYKRPAFLIVLPIAYMAAAALREPVFIRMGVEAFGQLAILFVICMICHGELYRLRPAPSRLTSYYLAIAAGGALGGALVAIIAPFVFTYRTEYMLALYGCAALLMTCMFTDVHSRWHRGSRRVAWLSYVMVVLFTMVWMQLQRQQDYKNVFFADRNFYGVITLTLHNEHTELMYVRMNHGRIVHGAQMSNPEHRRAAITYYSPHGGLGLALRRNAGQIRRVGIIGLGTGTVATYGRPGDVFRFYEIDPNVTDIALHRFTYLEDTPATVEVIMGDARLSMEREDPQQYDVLVLDAFSGDAIPVHLLTREAFELYNRHLKPNGIIVAHISNRNLDLMRVLLPLADVMKYRMLEVKTSADQFLFAARWVLLTRDHAIFDEPLFSEGGQPPEPATPRATLWTDEYAPLLQVLR